LYFKKKIVYIHVSVHNNYVYIEAGGCLGGQESAAKKIAQLESMKKQLDQQSTPSGSRFKSAKDELKEQLSSIKAGLAASHAEAERGGEDVRAKVRNQLSQLHDQVAAVAGTNDDDDDDDDDNANNASAIKSPGDAEGGQQAPPWSSKREQLKAKLQSYQAQLRIAKTQGIARRLDNDSDGEDAESRPEQEKDLKIHTAAVKAELEVGDTKKSAHDERAQKIQDDIQKSLENIKKMEAGKAPMDASPRSSGSAGAISNAPGSWRGMAGKDSSPYAGVFPQSDHFDEVGAGTKRSAAKTGAGAPAPLKPAATDSSILAAQDGAVDEEDGVVLAEERLRVAYDNAWWFAILMCALALLSLIFGFFMPFGFSVWAIGLPLALASGYFLRYCCPLPIPATGDSSMPLSLAWVSVTVVYVACFLFVSGILSASASLSIAPLVGTPVCAGNIPPPRNYTMPPAAVLAPAKNMTTSPNNKTSGYTVPATGVTNTSGVERLHALSGLDPDTLIKLGGCRAWNMCSGKGIKWLTCGGLKGFNDWNAVFFFLSSFLIAPLWLWIYYVITVRLQENAAAASTGTTTVLDCSAAACYLRLKEAISDAYAAEEPEEWDEEKMQRSAPKFEQDGPFRTQSIGSNGARNHSDAYQDKPISQKTEKR
jgi:hypothetical protein